MYDLRQCNGTLRKARKSMVKLIEENKKLRKVIDERDDTPRTWYDWEKDLEGWEVEL